MDDGIRSGRLHFTVMHYAGDHMTGMDLSGYFIDGFIEHLWVADADADPVRESFYRMLILVELSQFFCDVYASGFLDSQHGDDDPDNPKWVSNGITYPDRNHKAINQNGMGNRFFPEQLIDPVHQVRIVFEQS